MSEHTPDVVTWRGPLAAFNRPDRYGNVIPYVAAIEDYQLTTRDLPSALPVPLLYLPADLGDGTSAANRAGQLTRVWAKIEGNTFRMYGEGIAGGPAAAALAAGDRLACGLDLRTANLETIQDGPRRIRMRHDWKIIGLTVWPLDGGPSAFDFAGIELYEPDQEGTPQ